jgi:hypothetical protein
MTHPPKAVDKSWKKTMTHHNYRHSDLETLTSAIGAIQTIGGLPCIEISCAGKAFTLLASAEDFPPPMRLYYAKVEQKLTNVVTRLRRTLRLSASEGFKLESRINSALHDLELTAEDMSRLRHVNARLLKLEKSLKQITCGMRDRLDGLVSASVDWDEWDSTEIKLWAEIGQDPERPTYDPDAWSENGEMESIKICVRITQSWAPNATEGEKPWGLDDGQNHSDMGGCSGHPMQYFNQCYLFHELFGRANVGIWGMLHLRSLWIEIIPHRSGEFVI